MTILKHWFICRANGGVEVRGFVLSSDNEDIPADSNITISCYDRIGFTERDDLNFSFCVSIEDEMFYFDWSETLLQNLYVTLMTLPSLGITYEMAAEFEDYCNGLNNSLNKAINENLDNNTLVLYLAGNSEAIPIVVYAKLNNKLVQAIVDDENCITFNKRKIFSYSCDTGVLNLNVIPTIKNIVVHNSDVALTLSINKRTYAIKPKEVCKISHLVL